MPRMNEESASGGGGSPESPSHASPTPSPSLSVWSAFAAARQLSVQSGTPSSSVSVSGVPQPQMPASVLSGSAGQPSSQSGVPSPSESVSAMPQPQVPAEVLSGSSGQPSSQSGVPSPSLSVSAAPQPQAPGATLSGSCGQPSSQSGVLSWSLSVSGVPQPHVAWRRLAGIVGATVVAVRHSVVIAVGVGRSAAARAGRRLVGIVGAAIVAVRHSILIVVRIRLAAAAGTRGRLFCVVRTTIARVAQAIVVRVELSGVRNVGAVVEAVGNSVEIAVVQHFQRGLAAELHTAGAGDSYGVRAGSREGGRAQGKHGSGRPAEEITVGQRLAVDKPLVRQVGARGQHGERGDRALRDSQALRLGGDLRERPHRECRWTARHRSTAVGDDRRVMPGRAGRRGIDGQRRGRRAGQRRQVNEQHTIPVPLVSQRAGALGLNRELHGLAGADGDIGRRLRDLRSRQQREGPGVVIGALADAAKENDFRAQRVVRHGVGRAWRGCVLRALRPPGRPVP